MNPNATLTKREAEIAELFAWGASKKEVAAKLYVSPRTVENHARSIYEKAEVHSVNQLSAWWFCKKFSIPFDLSPVLSLLFLFLVIANELNTDNSDMVRPSRTTKTARAGRRKNENTIEL